ncbi:surface protease GP63 [Trypanosoma theileri]|uniref:Leishmanolysin-like peptidase n=1 Tax=Trypanosoma theileri TaxID=67003 RepID=A0A1X0P0I8_9TRYP|nr:surface protease GP63 [Trypanosoma theileri]ORC90019.1 surface protease GP63 [Trypanosoma theileri]
MSWGNQSICDLLEVESGQKLIDYFALFWKGNDKVILQCTSDRFALGIRSKTDLNDSPEGYEYVQNGTKEANDLMDNVSFIRPLKGTACEDGNESLMPGSLFGRDSRCLNVKEPAEFKENKGDTGSGVKVYGICAKVKCESGNKVSVLLKGENEKESWHDCSDGKKTFDVVAGSVFIGGKIECPKYEEVCIGLLEDEPPTDIKFYDGNKVTNGYEGDVIIVKEEKEEGNDQNSSSASAGSVGSSGSHDTAAAAATTTSQSSSNPNGTNLTEGQMKEKPNHTNDARRPDSSIMVISYMAPLALLMCVVGFVMVP